MNFRGDDLFLCAVKNNALKCVRVLNRKGWKVFPNDGGFNAIITAVKLNNIEMVRELVHKIDLVKEELGNTMQVLEVIFKEDNLEILAYRW